MDRKTQRKNLATLIQSRSKVKLTRNLSGEEYHNGFVLGLGRDWVLLQQFNDFFPDGYTALRLQDITSIRSGPYEHYFEHILREEGILAQLPAPESVSLDSLMSLLLALQQRGGNVILECEERDEDALSFFLGKLIAVDALEVRIAAFDALGNWESTPDIIGLAEVTQVQFDTSYIQVFSRHLKGPCPH